MLDPADLSGHQIHPVAAELGAPTTGFVTGTNTLEPLRTRFFTPTEEIAMCGHVVVALASALRDAGVKSRRLQLSADAGLVGVRLLDDQEVAIELPPWARLSPSVTPSDVWKALDLDGGALDSGGLLGLASAGLRHLFVPIRDVAKLSRLDPDPLKIRALRARVAFDTLGAYTVVDRAEGEVTVRLRDFTAPIGVAEEPASGTTTGALTGLLAASLPEVPERFTLLAHQGVELGRPSEIRGVVWSAPRGRLLEVRGRAYRTLVGRMAIPGGMGEARLSVVAGLIG